MVVLYLPRTTVFYDIITFESGRCDIMVALCKSSHANPSPKLQDRIWDGKPVYKLCDHLLLIDIHWRCELATRCGEYVCAGGVGLLGHGNVVANYVITVNYFPHSRLILK